MTRTAKMPAMIRPAMARPETGRYTWVSPPDWLVKTGTGSAMMHLAKLPSPASAFGSIVAAARIGDIGEHGPAGGIPGTGTTRLHLAGSIQENLVLQNFLDDNGHVVVATHFHQGPGPRIQGHHTFLNQGG